MDFDRMIDYMTALSLNNERDWFHENHKWYENASADFRELLELLRITVAENAPEIAPDILLMNVKDWIYRIARDMRFYKNRPPYDPSFRAYISADKKSWLPIGYFIRIAPDGVLFGTGLWRDKNDEINIIRDYISAHFYELQDMLITSDLELTGNKLKKVPAGYDTADPAAELLKLKDWFIKVTFEPEQLKDFESFTALIGDAVKRMEPVRQFLCRAARSGSTQRGILEQYYK